MFCTPRLIPQQLQLLLAVATCVLFVLSAGQLAAGTDTTPKAAAKAEGPKPEAAAEVYHHRDREYADYYNPRELPWVGGRQEPPELSHRGYDNDREHEDYRHMHGGYDGREEPEPSHPGYPGYDGPAYGNYHPHHGPSYANNDNYPMVYVKPCPPNNNNNNNTGNAGGTCECSGCALLFAQTLPAPAHLLSCQHI